MWGLFLYVQTCQCSIAHYFLPMPYEWTPDTSPKENWDLNLWPYRSLLRRDFVLFFGSTALIVALPLIVLLGQPVLWGILPFFAVMLWGLWAAISTSYKRGEVLETLTGTSDTVTLTRINPDGRVQNWTANRYWASVHLHQTGGPVENYLTLRGGDREVEIGAFLDAKERLALYGEIKAAFVSGPSKAE